MAEINFLFILCQNTSRVASLREAIIHFPLILNFYIVIY